MSTEGRLAEIWIYPIKSCRGISLQSVELTELGPAHDRRFMLVSENGRFLSQRTHPRLALVGVELLEDAGTLRVSAPQLDALQLAPALGETRIETSIFGDDLSAPVASQAASEWFSNFLGEQVTLVASGDEQSTQPVPKTRDIRTGFADGFPWLAISQASLDTLNAKLDTPVSIRNFRPNLVFDGIDAHAEDQLGRLRIGHAIFEGLKLCGRCRIPNVDPDRGVHAGPEPTKTLATYRRDGSNVNFGQNMVHHVGTRVSVGDPVAWV